MDHQETPLLTALQLATKEQHAAFYTPGHKKGERINTKIKDLLGKQVFRSDLPELPGLDNLFAPTDAIAKAQKLAADCFGASQTWFLVNGSTCGIIAAILATCGEGDKIILPRNSHQSAIAGLILSGAIPIFINPEYNPQQDLIYSITPAAVEKTLQIHPDSKAVMVLHPSYQGICGDLRAIADITHNYNIPLLVDEAHGAHFGFHPDLPPSALSVGADLTVQSTHKVLSAMTQASMLHLQGTRIDPQRISKALQLVESTSPSYILLASLDAARQQMALQGRELMAQTIALAQSAKKKLAKITGIELLEFLPQPGFAYLDPTRLTINISQLGITGYEADEILCDKLGVICELPLLKHLTFIVSLGNMSQDIEQLISALQALANSCSLAQSSAQNVTFNPSWHKLPLLELSPRQAYFSATETIPLLQARDRISGELICPYPPGIPLLMPGEIITQETIHYLQELLKLGGIIAGCSDNTLTTVQVIR